MATERLNTMDLSEGSIFSDLIDIEGMDYISIQPIVKNLIGNPTYSIYCSNDDGKSVLIPTEEDEEYFFLLSNLYDNMSITLPIVISLVDNPWSKMKIKTSGNINSSGIVEFNINIV